MVMQVRRLRTGKLPARHPLYAIPNSGVKAWTSKKTGNKNADVRVFSLLRMIFFHAELSRYCGKIDVLTGLFLSP